jgi:hypothetical protein
MLDEISYLWLIRAIAGPIEELMKKPITLLLVASGLLLTKPLFADNETTTIPLQVIQIAPSSYKVGITVSVAGGPPTMVTFDTGGEGLHIFANQVGNMNITYTDKKVKSSYVSGLVYEGVIAYAPVSFNGLSTKPIPIEVIQKAYCMKNKPNCGAGSDPNNPTPVYGQFYGELGAGMRIEPRTNLYTPFRALPGNYSTGFIIQNLNPNGNGQLVIGLTPDNTAGYNKVSLTQVGTYPDGKPVYDDKGLMVNYTIGDVSDNLHTAFDTGGGPIVTLFTGNSEGFVTNRRQLIRRNQNFTASLPSGFTWSFTTGNIHAQNAVRIGPVLAGKGAEVNTGITFYFNYNVIYDFQNGQLGFMQHS